MCLKQNKKTVYVFKVIHLSSSVDSKKCFGNFIEDTTNVDHMIKVWPLSMVGISHKINLFRLTSDLHRFPQTNVSFTGISAWVVLSSSLETTGDMLF